MKYLSTKTQKGFGIVEAIFSVAIFIAAVTVVIGGYIYSQQETMNSSHRAQAVMLTDEGIEAAKLLSYDDFSNLPDGTYGLQLNEGAWSLTENPEVTDIYTRTVQVTTLDANRKEVQITVDYDGKSLSQTTQLTQWNRESEGGSCLEPVPTVSSTLDLPGFSGTGKVQTSGDYAYFLDSDSDNDLTIVDISEPASPAIMGSLAITGDATDMVLNGSFAYITTTADNAELVIVNVSNPSSPSIIGTYDKAGNSDASGVFVDGDTAYLSNEGDTELIILDVSTPSSPVLVGSLDVGSSANDLVASGDYVYLVTEQTTESPACINISDKSFYIPLRASSSGTYPTRGTSSDSVSLTSWGNYSEGYLWIDLVFPGLPSGFRDAVLSITFEDLDLIHRGLNAGSQWVYLLEAFTLTDSSQNQLAELRNVHHETEIINGNRVTICHKYNTPAEQTKYQNINSLEAHLNHGDHLGVCLDDYSVDYYDPEDDGEFTWEYDVDNSLLTGSSLTLKALFESHTELFYGNSISLSNTSESITDISLCGVTTSATGNSDLIVIDVSTPDAPAVVTTFPLTSVSGTANDIEIAGSTLYIAQGSSFQTIDISTPNVPSAQDSIDLGDTISDIGTGSFLCDGDSVPVATYNDSAEFQLINVSNPSSLSVSAQTDIDGNGSLNGVAYNADTDRVLTTKSEVDGESFVIVAPN